MIIEADLSAAELRVITQLSGDVPWQQAFQSGGSPHGHTMGLLFPQRALLKGSEEYVFSKSFNFRWTYSIPGKVANVDGGQLRTYRVQITPDLLATATAELDRGHPAVVAWKRNRIAQLHQTRHVTNAWGRYRDLTWALKAGTSEDGLRWRDHAESVALNFPIQGAIGEHMNDCFVNVWDDLMLQALGRQPRTVWEGMEAVKVMLGLGTTAPQRVVAQCHDALIVHCTDDRDVIKLVAGTLKRTIARPIPELGGLVIPAEIQVGATWGQVKPYNVQ